FLAAGEQTPGKQAMAQTPAKPLPDHIIHRPEAGFSRPVEQWMEEEGIAGQQCGLRSWAMRVYNNYGTLEYQPQSRRKRVLALIPDAFGAGGGMAKFDRDLLTAASTSPDVSNIVALMRIQPKPAVNLPFKMHYNVRGIGRDNHCISGKINYLRELRHILIDYKKIDLIICGLIGMVPLAWLVARLKHAPFVCIIHGVDAWQPNHSRLVNWVIRHANAVIAVSEYTRQRFIKWSNVEANKVILLPNCYDPALYEPGPKPEYLLSRYGLHGKDIVMTLGRLAGFERYKGFDEILEVLPKLRQESPNIVYLIVGDGGDKARLQQKAETLDIVDRVIFTGYIPEMEKADHYRIADAYVMPSRGEGFGIVYLEAMACGIPTVGSKLDGSRDALRNGQLGLLADPTNLDEVQEAILQALSKSKGIPEGLDYFSVGAYRTRTHDLLKRLLASREKYNE
ncbi:MAG: glycosyltransferase, partial [bacterium]|nr:glycosyltransferase [bacterium]